MMVGIDTNVLLYSLDSDSPFHEESREALAALVQEQSAVLTQQNLVELAVALTRRGVEPETAESCLRDFSAAMPVLRPTNESLELFMKHLKASLIKGLRLFDLYLAATLMSNGIDLIYTYNERDFQGIEGLRIWRP